MKSDPVISRSFDHLLRARARQKCRDSLLDCWLEGMVDYMPS